MEHLLHSSAASKHKTRLSLGSTFSATSSAPTISLLLLQTLSCDPSAREEESNGADAAIDHRGQVLELLRSDLEYHQSTGALHRSLVRLFHDDAWIFLARVYEAETSGFAPADESCMGRMYIYASFFAECSIYFTLETVAILTEEHGLLLGHSIRTLAAIFLHFPKATHRLSSQNSEQDGPGNSEARGRAAELSSFLIRIIANLSYGCPYCQDEVRRANGLHLLLNAMNIDPGNPLVKVRRCDLDNARALKRKHRSGPFSRCGMCARETKRTKRRSASCGCRM